MKQTEFLADLSALGGQWVYTFVALGALALGPTDDLFFALLAAFILLFAALIIIRLLFPRARPEPRHGKGVYGRIDNQSFPSLHAMRASALGTVLALWYPVPAFIVLCAAGVLGVGMMRILFRRHDIYDVTAGILFGALAGVAGAWVAA